MELTILALLLGSVVAQVPPLSAQQRPLRVAQQGMWRIPQSLLRIHTSAHGSMKGFGQVDAKVDDALPEYREQQLGLEQSPPSSDDSAAHLSRRAVGALLGAGVFSLGSGLPALAEEDSYGIGTGGGLIVLADPGVTDRTWKPPVKKGETKLTFEGTVKKGQKATLMTADKTPWPDVSSCEGFVLNVKNSAPYNDLFLGFGTKGGGWKANIPLGEPSDDYKAIIVPFTLFADSQGVRPDEFAEENLEQLTFTAEGPGKFRVAIKDVSAYGCKRGDQIPKGQELEKLVNLQKSSGTLAGFLLVGATGFGFLAFAISARNRARPIAAAPPLLG